MDKMKIIIVLICFLIIIGLISFCYFFYVRAYFIKDDVGSENLKIDDNFSHSKEDEVFLLQLQYGENIVRIDNDYRKALENALFESDYVEIAYRYLEIWQEELDFLNNEIVKYLSPEEKEQYIQVSDKWEQCIEEIYTFEEKILSKDGELLNGTSYKYTFIMAKKDAVRDRVIYINQLITTLSLASI